MSEEKEIYYQGEINQLKSQHTTIPVQPSAVNSQQDHASQSGKSVNRQSQTLRGQPENDPQSSNPGIAKLSDDEFLKRRPGCELENITEDNIMKNEDPEELIEFFGDRNNCFTWIKNIDLTDEKNNDELAKLYSKNPESKDEILKFLLDNNEFKIYAFLQYKNINFSSEQKNFHHVESLNGQQKDDLQKEIDKYFMKIKDAHILFLISKSEQGGALSAEVREENNILSEKQFKEKIQTWYEKLNEIKEISTTLQVISARCSGLERIVFDFTRESVIGVSITYGSHNTLGLTDYQAGRITVGAKGEEEEILGTLAHELEHFAMQMVFGNNSKPYSKHDNIEEFDVISKNIHKDVINQLDIDPIIKIVFHAYPPHCWHAELIVRVPNILGKYGRKKGINLLEEKEGTKALLEYYKKKVVNSYKNFIRDQHLFHPRNNLALLNPCLGVMDKITEISIEFKKSIDINSFLENEVNYLLIETKSLWLTVRSIYQTLEFLDLNKTTKSYLFINEIQLKEEIFDIFETDAIDKLVILLSDSLKKEISLKDLDQIVKRKTNKKVIFISTGYNPFKNENYLKIVDEIKFSNLTATSQSKILEKKVNFQGIEVTLNDLMKSEPEITELLPLADLLDEKPFNIGKDLVISNGYDEALYIGRTFRLYIEINKSILDDKELSNSLTFSEEEFEKLCQANQHRNIYLLKKELDQPLILQRSQSQGMLRELFQYIDGKYHSFIETYQCHSYPPEDLNSFLEQAQRQKVMLIADTAGMGKSTVLTHLSKQIKKTAPTHWVVKIDLNDHTKVLKEKAETDRKMENIEFLLEKLLKLDSPLEKGLFKQRLEEGKVVLMLDGFDEIAPNYKNIVIDLLQDLKKTSVEHQLWVTTRPHLRKELENKLQQLSYTLVPFSEENQVDFLTKFWGQNKIESQHLKIYAEKLIKCLASSINDKMKEFTGIPLQSFMLAEVFQKDAMEFLPNFNNSKSGLPYHVDLAELYNKFIKQKLDVFDKKCTFKDGNLIDPHYFDLNDISFRKIHQKLALTFLFPEQEDIFTELNNKLSEISLTDDLLKQLNRIGIVQMTEEGNPHFIHRTFAEYFAADFLVNQLIDETENNPLIKFLLSEILLQPDYQVIRSFLNSQLKKKQLKGNSKFYGEQMFKLLEDDLNKTTKYLQKYLYIAAEEGNAEIIKFFHSSFKMVSAIDHDAYINYLDKNTKQSAIDLAWENASYDVMLVLLKADSNFPSEFTLDALYQDDDISDEIKTYVKEREQLHTWVKEDNLDKIKKFVLEHDELKFLNSQNKPALEVAAKHTGVDTLLVLLRISPLTLPEKITLSDVQLKLLNHCDDKGNTLLIKSIKNQKNLVDVFFRCGVDINHRNKKQQNAIDLAWENNNYRAVLSLLNSKSALPMIEGKPFKLENIPEDDRSNKVPKELIEFFEERNKFFTWIKNNDLTDETKKSELVKLTQSAYLKNTVCKDEILGFLLDKGKFDIYAFLQSNKINFSTEQKNIHHIKSFTDERKDKLQKECIKYFTPIEDAHIRFLISKSENAISLSADELKKFKEQIEGWYKELDKIPEISTILQVISARYSGLERIVFDFTKKSVIGMYTHDSHTAPGLTDYQTGRIFVGAKDDEKEILGTLAHQLDHFAMQRIFENEFNPYSKYDNAKEFENISYRIQNNIEKLVLDPIITNAFENSNSELWHSELIVRVPHILAKYGREEGIKLLEKAKETKQLLRYYKKKVVGSYKNFIRDQHLIHPRSNLALLIPYLGVMDKITKISIEFKKSIDINSFLENKENYLLVQTKSLWLSVRSIYQTLEFLNLNKTTKNYLFINEIQFKKEIFDIFKTDAIDKLVVLSSDSLNKDKLFKDLDEILKRKPNKKVIFISTGYNPFKNENYLKIVDEIKFSNLTKASQSKILRKKVTFQGIEATLNELMTPQSPITELLPLADLLDEKPFNIGKDLPISNGYDEALYIGRTFRLYIEINKSILDDKELSNSLTFSEEEFQKLCQANQHRNIYLLKKELDQPLILQRSQSQGMLRELFQYIDEKYHSFIETYQRHSYPPEDLNNFLEQAQRQKIMIIADTAGMGKSTVLTHLSKQIKKTAPTHWVVKIDLNDHTKVLKEKAETDRKMENIEFLSEKLLKLDSPLEKGLFKQCLEEGRVVLMLDGFDEINPNYNDTIIDLLQDLKKTSVEQLWVTTRPHLRQALEDKLQQLSYTLEPLPK